MCTMNSELTSGQRLMAESRHMGVEVKVAADKLDRLESENAKLRELAKAAWGCVKRTVSCDECRIVACGCTLQSAMRELGIEVNDG